MVLETERVNLAIFFQANPTLFSCSEKTFTFRFRCFLEDLLLVKEGEKATKLSQQQDSQPFFVTPRQHQWANRNPYSNYRRHENGSYYRITNLLHRSYLCCCIYTSHCTTSDFKYHYIFFMTYKLTVLIFQVWGQMDRFRDNQTFEGEIKADFVKYWRKFHNVSKIPLILKQKERGWIWGNWCKDH